MRTEPLARRNRSEAGSIGDGRIVATDALVSDGGSRPVWLTHRLTRQPLWVYLVAAAIGVHLRHRWTPIGDHALTALWTDAVGGRGTPLVGGDSRFGWNHLGPWLFYLFAMPYRLLGRSPRGILLGAGLINLVSLTVIARAARDAAGRTAATILTAGGLLFLLGASGARLVDPWNPYVVLLPFLAAVVACWAVLCGQHRWMVGLIAAGSLSVQAHIAFLPPVAVLVVGGGVSMLRRRTATTRTALHRTAIVTVVAWTPPLIDLLTPGRHNLIHVAKFFSTASPNAVAGLRSGISVVLRETSLVGDWLGGHPGVTPFGREFDGHLGWAPGVGLAVLASVGYLAWRRHERELGSLVAITGALLVVGAVELGGTHGPLFPYLFGWIGVVAMLCWITIPLAVLKRLDRAGSRRVDAASSVLVAALAVILLVVNVDGTQPRSPLERADDATIVEQLTDDITPQLDHHRRYRLVHGSDVFNSIYEHGVANQLLRDGYHLRVPSRLGFLFGRRLVDPRSDGDPAIEIIAPYRGSATAPGILAVNDPLTPTERTEEIQLTNELVDAYARDASSIAVDIVERVNDQDVAVAGYFANDPNHQHDLDRLADLRGRGRPVAVVLHN